MPKHSRILAAVLGAALAVGCDSPSAPKPSLPSVHVQYSGAVSGHFSVTRGKSTSQFYSEDFWGDSSGFVSYSYVGSGDGAVNLVAMSGPVFPGDYTILGNLCTARCYGVTVGLGHAADDSAPREGEVSWYLERGTINVRQPDAAGHVRGTFSGSGQIHTYTHGKWQDLGEVTASGTFETGLVPPHRPS